MDSPMSSGNDASAVRPALWHQPPVTLPASMQRAMRHTDLAGTIKPLVTKLGCVEWLWRPQGEHEHDEVHRVFRK